MVRRIWKVCGNIGLLQLVGSDFQHADFLDGKLFLFPHFQIFWKCHGQCEEGTSIDPFENFDGAVLVPVAALRAVDSSVS